MKKEIFGVYCPDHDMTFIMEKVFNGEWKAKSLEVKGFYYGKPNALDNRIYYDTYIDEFYSEAEGGTK